ncbi:hypothetical protein ACFL3M_00920 [Patescibacteria group bacterium]
MSTIQKSLILSMCAIVIVGGGVSAAKPDAEARKAEKAAAQEARVEERAALKEEREEAREERKEEKESQMLEKICDRIEKVISRIESSTAKRMEKNQEKLQDRAEKLNQVRENKQNAIENRREARDKQRENFYAYLEGVAETDEQKQAVADFKIAVDAAVEDRRLAIDTAIEVMQEGVDEAVAARMNSMENLMTEFSANESELISAAQSSCSEDMELSEARDILKNLRTDLNSLRQTFKSDIGEIKKVNETISDLKDIKNESIKIAVDKFNTAVDAARDDLKNVLGDIDVYGEQEDETESE